MPLLSSFAFERNEMCSFISFIIFKNIILVQSERSKMFENVCYQLVSYYHMALVATQRFLRRRTTRKRFSVQLGNANGATADGDH